MARYKQGDNRRQQLLFPPSLDEYVSEDNAVRVIDEYVEILNIAKLDLDKNLKNSLDGQKAYNPKLFLKIYIYGYMNRVRSSRRLETEIKRNIEMMWLCENLTPTYKSIANFRKDHSQALKQVFKAFSLMLKNIDLISGDVVAVDGAFLRANASKNQLISKKTLQQDSKEIDEKINEYLTQLETSDNDDIGENLLVKESKKLTNLKAKKAQLDKNLAMLEEMGENQYNKTDPDAKLMIKPAHNLMAYNSQIAVDAKHKFIVATDVSSEGNDNQKLHQMAQETKAITHNEKGIFLADSGYYSAKEIDECEANGIETVVAIPNKTKQQKDRGYFTPKEFQYDKDSDCYICPNNQTLTKSSSTIIKENGTKYYVYRAGSKTCKECPLREKCIPQKTAYKRISRSQYANTIEAYTQKMQSHKAKELIKQRGSIVEHPFGTIKRNLGWEHYLVRGKEKVSGENALIMFTYNFKRLLNLIGIALFRELIRAIKDNNLEQIRTKIALHIASFYTLWLYYFKMIGFYELRVENDRF
jgi:transposase